MALDTGNFIVEATSPEVRFFHCLSSSIKSNNVGAVGFFTKNSLFLRLSASAIRYKERLKDESFLVLLDKTLPFELSTVFPASGKKNIVCLASFAKT